MTKRLHSALTLAILMALGLSVAHLRAAAESAAENQGSSLDQTPLTPDQVSDLITRTIANQHRDDAAVDSFERFEQHATHSRNSSGPVIDEKSYRVVPTGSGTLRLLIRENGSPVSAALYHRQLRDWENILQVAVHADDPRQIAVVAKQQKKRKDRARFVDAVTRAYRITWLGREVRDGRTVEKLQFEPDPNYPLHGDTTDWLTHARATAWIDPQAAQVVFVHATVLRDISIGGGVLGKIYRGGEFIMQQTPVAPDIWEPTLYQYDISGRKFLFSFALHEVTSISHYALLDTPDKALLEARDNLAHCCTVSDP